MKMFVSSAIGRWLILPIGCAALTFFSSNHSASAQAEAEAPVVVTAETPGAFEEVPSAYGAPPEFSRSRFSNVVNAYVLPPWAFFFGELFEGQGFRHGPPDYLFTQEIEMGLPYRFNVAAETELERFNGGGRLQIGTRFRSTRQFSPNINSASAPFDAKKFRRLPEEEKRKKAARLKFPMPTKF